MESRNVQFDVGPVAKVFKGVMLPGNVKFYPVVNRVMEPRSVQFKFRVMFKVSWSLEMYNLNSGLCSRYHGA